MNYKKVEVTIKTVDESGKEEILTFPFEGSVNVVFEHQVPTIPTFTHLGGEATFKTTGTETLVLNLVNKSTPRKV